MQQFKYVWMPKQAGWQCKIRASTRKLPSTPTAKTSDTKCRQRPSQESECGQRVGSGEMCCTLHPLLLLVHFLGQTLYQVTSPIRSHVTNSFSTQVNTPQSDTTRLRKVFNCNFDASLLGQNPNVRNNQACGAYEYASNWLCSEAMLRMRIVFLRGRSQNPINKYLQYM